MAFYQELPIKPLQNTIAKLLGHQDALTATLSNLSGTVPSLNERARFYCYEIEQAGRKRRFFVKLTPADSMYLGVNSLAAMIELPVPALRAKGVWRGYFVAVFDFIEGESLLTFRRSPNQYLEQVAEAMATVNVRTNQCLTAGWDVSEIRRQSGLLWVKSYAKDATQLLSTKMRSKRLLAYFVRHEDAFITWARSLPNQTINHTDCRPANILVAADGVSLLDWDAANYGPWGASLWQMARLSKARRTLVANKYVETLQGFGYDIDSVLVERVMIAQHIFWELDRGLQRQNPIVVHKALRRFKRYLAKDFL